MRNLVALLTLAAVCYSASLAGAQRFAPGYCPTVAAHENFDKTRFFGNWIEVEKTPSIFDLMMRCLVVDYSDDQDNTVNVVVRGISLAGLPLTVNGDGLLQDVHRSGFYSIRYGFGVPFQGTLTTIIDTDYDDYAVVYSCTNSLLSGVFHSEYIWVLSRSGKISNPTRQNIYEKLDKLGINRSGLTMSDRSTCPTNSSTVARESDKDLAAVQAVGSPLSPGGVSGSLAGSPAVVAPAAGSSESALSASGQAIGGVEKVGGEQAQKSVVVPLLYDLPSPASSSSVGGSSKASAAKAPLAPVENKVPQLPMSSSVPSKQGAASPGMIAPGQQQQQQGANLLAKIQEPAPKQSAASPSQPIAAQQSPVASAAQAAKPSSQQPQQQSLMSKIQQKPNSAQHEIAQS